MELNSVSGFLASVFDERRRRNPRYSLRAFARDLDTSVSFLSDVLNDRRSLSLEKLVAILELLKIPHREATILKLTCELEHLRTDEGKRLLRTEIERLRGITDHLT